MKDGIPRKNPKKIPKKIKVKIIYFRSHKKRKKISCLSLIFLESIVKVLEESFLQMSVEGKMVEDWLLRFVGGSKKEEVAVRCSSGDHSSKNHT